MQRVTVTLDDDLVQEIDELVAAPATRTAPKQSATWRAPAFGRARIDTGRAKDSWRRWSTFMTTTHANSQSG